MNSKFFQVIDTMHGMIYYTGLERYIIRTPFFNRLHDVNQNSTVYLAFPPNRTKRYEHSLGTMDLTSTLFFNATVNARNTNAFNYMMSQTNLEFKKIEDKIKHRGDTFISNDGNISSVMQHLARSRAANSIQNMIEKEFDNYFGNNCLFNTIPADIGSKYYAFLYLCLLQSLRIAALLHDIGHPPQSHTIESVLTELDSEIRKKQDTLTIRENEFLEILAPYRDINSSFIKEIDSQMAIHTEFPKREALHEMIGLQLTKCILETTMPEYLAPYIEDPSSSSAKLHVLYANTVIEFVFALLRNKNNFWHGLHSIIDGTIDTDRMDYIPRDSANSGMSWGAIPYQRLINTACLKIPPENDALNDSKDKTKSIRICFLVKNVEAMDQMLTDRFKIFTLINYHHRSARVATLYKKSVKLLAEQYLQAEPSEGEELSEYIFEDISGLWKALQSQYTSGATILTLIQWNDSWLNDLLQRHMINNSTMIAQKLTPNDTATMYLQEIFLNSRQHISLIKRQRDMDEINSQILGYIKSLKEELTKEIAKVRTNLKLYDAKDTDMKIRGKMKSDYTEDKELFDRLIELWNALDKMDWGALLNILSNSILNDAMNVVKAAHEDEIESYLVEEVKIGPGTGEAFVYDNRSEFCADYYEYSNIKEVLSKARLGFPFFYINIKSKTATLSSSALSNLRSNLGKALGECIANRVYELYDIKVT